MLTGFGTLFSRIPNRMIISGAWLKASVNYNPPPGDAEIRLYRVEVGGGRPGIDDNVPLIVGDLLASWPLTENDFAVNFDGDVSSIMRSCEPQEFLAGESFMLVMVDAADGAYFPSSDYAVPVVSHFGFYFPEQIIELPWVAYLSFEESDPPREIRNFFGTSAVEASPYLSMAFGVLLSQFGFEGMAGASANVLAAVQLAKLIGDDQ